MIKIFVSSVAASTGHRVQSSRSEREICTNVKVRFLKRYKSVADSDWRCVETCSTCAATQPEGGKTSRDVLRLSPRAEKHLENVSFCALLRVPSWRGSFESCFRERGKAQCIRTTWAKHSGAAWAKHSRAWNSQARGFRAGGWSSHI